MASAGVKRSGPKPRPSMPAVAYANEEVEEWRALISELVERRLDPEGGAAKWLQRGKSEATNRQIYDSQAVPANATRFEAIVIYTDVFDHPPTKSLGRNGLGDLPIVMGSFTGTKKADGTWDIHADNDEAIQQEIGKPEAISFADRIDKVRKLLLAITGFRLISRPESLDAQGMPRVPETENDIGIKKTEKI